MSGFPSPPDNPYLGGAYAPIFEERAWAHDQLEVIGEIPRDLRGVYVRNGPNPRFAPRARHHWFDGDGMLHALSVEDGRVSYRNRWIRTRGFVANDEAGRELWTGLLEPVKDNPKGSPWKDTANTDVLWHRDRLIALWYIAGVPYAIDPRTLETCGVAPFAADQKFRVSAHAKCDRRTGELLFFDYGPRPPWMTYGVVGPDGALKHHVPIELPGPRLPHDMALTENFSILMDLPVFHRPEAMKVGRWIVDYHRELPARFAVLPRYGQTGDVRWFEAEPCYIYHTVNAWEEDGAIVMIGCRNDEPIPPRDAHEGGYSRAWANLRLKARLHEWRFDLETGQTTERSLDDRNGEFPTMDERRLGVKTRYSYHATIPAERTLFFDGLVKYDLQADSAQSFAFGPGRYGSEAPFAPAEGREGEDEGYLLSFVHDTRESRSEAVILDARDIERGPVARVILPGRVPLGFHACWMPAEAF